MIKSDFFGGLFLSSHVLKGTFWWTTIGSIVLHALFEVCSSFQLAIIRVIHNYGKFKIAVAIPK